MSLTSRERVQAVLDHEVPDRVPIIFCGAIDTHRVLPFGSPDDVRAEVKRVIEILGADGGYMLASVHTIMPDVSPENILAMVDAAMEFGSYG